MAEIPEQPDDVENPRSSQDGIIPPADNDGDPAGKPGEATDTTEDDPASGAGYGNNTGEQ